MPFSAVNPSCAAFLEAFAILGPVDGRRGDEIGTPASPGNGQLDVLSAKLDDHPRLFPRRNLQYTSRVSGSKVEAIGCIVVVDTVSGCGDHDVSTRLCQAKHHAHSSSRIRSPARSGLAAPRIMIFCGRSARLALVS